MKIICLIKTNALAKKVIIQARNCSVLLASSIVADDFTLNWVLQKSILHLILHLNYFIIKWSNCHAEVWTAESIGKVINLRTSQRETLWSTWRTAKLFALNTLTACMITGWVLKNKFEYEYLCIYIYVGMCSSWG